MASQSFEEFYKEVKEIEEKDSVLTSKTQIERLLRPGSTYFNLNPFAVLDVDPDLPIEEMKKKYKRLSILVHPDKNRDDAERSQKAFDALNKAWRLLESEIERDNCYDVVEQAKVKVKELMLEKKKKLVKEGKPVIIEETDPIKFKESVYVHTTKIFADLERKRRQLEARDTEERKRQREQEIAEEDRKQYETEWNKNFEETRDVRIDSWLQFKKRVDFLNETPNPEDVPTPVISSPVLQSTSEPVRKKKKILKTFKPPKHKAENRG